MTTIVIIIGVALLFLVVLCILWLMIWRREGRRQADSLKAIERDLQTLGCSMKDYLNLQRNNCEVHASATNVGEADFSKLTIAHDVGEESSDSSAVKTAQEEHTEKHITDHTEDNIARDIIADTTDEHNGTVTSAMGEYDGIQQECGEISLDFADDISDDTEMQTDYNIGRSGKKYTASELETLIKE